MNGREILTVYGKELKDSLRDRRTLLSMIILPTVVMPALVFGVLQISARTFAKAREEIPVVMIIGGADSPGVVAQLQHHPRVRVAPLAADWRQRIAEKTVRAAVEIPAGFEAGLKAAAGSTVTIFNYAGELRSGFAANELEQFFRDFRERCVAERLAERQLPATLVKPFELQRENVAPPEKVGGAMIGGFVPYIIILLCFTGAMYPAMDLTAGEKERGTMETLLCSPASRTAIVLGKFLMVLTGSLSAMLLSLLSMALSAIAAGVMMTGGSLAAAHQAMPQAGATPTIDPLGVLGVLALVLPVAVLFAAVLFAIALFAKTMKEAQSYLTPLVFVVIVPTMVGVLPGFDLNAKLALVPLLNVSLACKEMLSGSWPWAQLALIFASTAVYAGAALALAVAMFKRESVLFRT